MINFCISCILTLMSLCAFSTTAFGLPAHRRSKSDARGLIALHAKATFSARNAGQLWSVPIKATAHNSAYVLRLEDPFYWYGGELEGVTLALHRAAEESNGRFMDENLLTRGASRDGTQEFQFEADDLARGMQKMAFGRTRTIRVPESGLVVKITVLNARVTPLASGDFQLDSLDLKIDVYGARR